MNNKMGVKTIPRFEFDRLLPHYPALETMMVEQVEWFSNRSGNLVGAIAKGERMAGWNYVILKRDRRGDLRVRKVMNNFSNLNAARADLLLSIAGIENIGCASQRRADLPSMPVEAVASNPER